MARLDRYLLSQLMALFGFFALVLVGVYWINRAVMLFDQLVGDGQSALVFLEISVLTLPNVIRLVLPVAGFVAAVYVTNRLTLDSELVVMQAAGVAGALPSAISAMRPDRLASPSRARAVNWGAIISVIAYSEQRPGKGAGFRQG